MDDRNVKPKDSRYQQNKNNSKPVVKNAGAKNNLPSDVKGTPWPSQSNVSTAKSSRKSKSKNDMKASPSNFAQTTTSRKSQKSKPTQIPSNEGSTSLNNQDDESGSKKRETKTLMQSRSQGNLQLQRSQSQIDNSTRYHPESTVMPSRSNKSINAETYGGTETYPYSETQVTNPTAKSQRDDKKCCLKSNFCDPRPEAYQIANEKARLRAADTRDPLYKLRQEEYNRHLAALDKMEAVVDNSCPYVPKAIAHGIQRANNSTLFQAKIEVANAKLLYKLAAIYNGTIKTGLQTRLLPSTKCIRNRTYERAMKAMNLVYQNIQKYQYLEQTKPMYSTEKLKNWYTEQRKHRDRICKYPSITKPKACPLPYRRVMEKALAKPRQYAYLLIEIEDLQAENLVIELYADMCPFTVKNFQRLCTNTKATACDCRTYRCKKVDRLHCVQVLDGSFRKLYWVIGEHVDSTVEYTPMMLQESSPISHTEAGLITRPKNRSGGAFFITIGPCKHLDKFFYVFGKIIGSGMEFLKKMQARNTEENGKTIINMHVTDCGVVNAIGEVPPPMLLQDFISQVRLEIMPFIKRDPDKPEQWYGGKATFAEHMRHRIAESQQRFEEVKKEGDEYAEEFPDDI